MTTFTPGMRIQCRDTEWLVTRVEIANRHDDQVAYCVGVDDMIRGNELVLFFFALLGMQ